MHLLRCGEITSATPNCEVWKHFGLDDKKPEPSKEQIPVVEITTSIPKNLKDYKFMYWDGYHKEWKLACTMHSPNDERAISMADDYYERDGCASWHTKCVLFDGNRMVKIY